MPTAANTSNPQCDETQPTCVNCSIGKLSCSYDNRTLSATTKVPQRSGPWDKAVPTPILPERQHVQGGTTDYPNVNMEHLELLHHFSFHIAEWMTVQDLITETTREAIISAGLANSFLMHQMLALSALHLSVVRPNQGRHHRDQADSLRLRALSIFNADQAEVNAENCVAMFLFTALVGVHVLFDTTSSHNGDFATFLESFTTYLDMFRGVKAVVKAAWPLLCQSELKSILSVVRQISPPSSEGVECQDLQDLLNASDLRPNARVYKDATEHLQWMFNANKALHASGGSHISSAWPVLVSVEYKELLAQRRPEALVILAYYAVTLYDRRRSWYVGDAGRFVIESVTSFLGKPWAIWLSWPNSVLAQSSDMRPDQSMEIQR